MSDVSPIMKWLDELARYFENRDTGGEDRAHWANVYNSENALKVKAALVASEARVKELEAENARLREALKPFAAAGLAIDLLDPSFPNEGAALRASFDYYTRHLGRNNDEIIDRNSVTAGDLRRARAALTGEKNAT